MYVMINKQGEFVSDDVASGMPDSTTNLSWARQFDSPREALEWAGGMRIVDEVTRVVKLVLVIDPDSPAMLVGEKERILAKGWDF